MKLSSQAPQFLAPRDTLALPVGRLLADRSSREVEITFHVRPATLPALASAIDAITTQVGTYLEGMHEYAAEDAATHAAEALGRLRAAVFSAVRAGHPNFRLR